MLQRRPAASPSRVLVLAGAAWLAFAALSAVFVHLAVRLPGGPDGMSDLHVYRDAVRQLLAGGSLYDFVSFNGDRFIYPPSAGLLMVPLAALPAPVLDVAWTLLQCAATVLLAVVVLRRASTPLLTRLPRPVALPLLACLLALSYPVFTGVFLGQVSLLVTLLVLLDALDAVPRRWQGVLTGLAAALKLTPLAFVPYLWLTGRRRAAVLATATYAAATLVSWLVVPGESVRFWSSVVAATPGAVDLGQTDNQSVHGLLARTALAEPARTVVVVAVTGLAGVLGYVRATRLHRAGLVLPGAVVLGALVVVVSPISWSHHQVALVLAAACVVRGWRTGVWSVGVYVLMTLPLPFLVPHVWPPLRLLTENAGLLLALLVCCALPFGTREQAPPRVSRARARSSQPADAALDGPGR